MNENFSKMQWKCRRGMLELDICLTRYLENYYFSASDEEKTQFNALLEENDTDIWDWLMKASQPLPHHQAIIEKIIAVNKTQ